MSPNLEEERKKKFTKALQNTYTGCIFDIDGTLTVRGDEFIPAYMHDLLGKLCLSVPMATCSARSFSHALDKMAPLFMKSPNPPVCQKNWILICENGSVGYRYDSTGKKYEEFYRIPYPYAESHRESLYAKIKSSLGAKLGASFINEVSLVFRPLNVEDPDREAVSVRSAEIAKVCEEILFSMDPKRLLKVGDAGIGVNVFPVAGDKEQGILRFAQYLTENMGLNFGPEAREIAVVGDQAQPDGNDEIFLNGKYGTPFTVGNLHPDNVFPLPVYNLEDGKVMTGPEATTYLLQHLKYKTL
jgi:hydroxymethylpyrimidine pyrophosphatase-like HAD family hydrolase